MTARATIVFYIGTFPHRDRDAHCKLPGCGKPDAVFVVFRALRISVLTLCPEHAAAARAIIGDKVDRILFDKQLADGDGGSRQNHVHRVRGGLQVTGRREADSVFFRAQRG